MSSPSEVEHILSPAPQDITMASSPPLTSSSTDQAAKKGGVDLKRSLSEKVELSVFDILNIFRCHWFLLRDKLMTNVISAQKAKDRNISWVKFTPQYHSHLVKCAIALVPHPVLTVKKVMFIYVLELLNGKGNLAFFNLQMGGHKANNAQKEKRRLARKQSRASKCEWEWEAAKAAHLSMCERQCVACGCEFESRKTAKKHKCPKAKVVRMGREAADGQALQATPTATLDKPPAIPTPRVPTALSSNSNAAPVVTEGSQDQATHLRWARNRHTGEHRVPKSEGEWQVMVATGEWRLDPL
jgi:hypothetical protein